VSGTAQAGVQSGTVKRGSATCPVCGHTTSVVRVRDQAKTKGFGYKLLSVVFWNPGVSDKSYKLPRSQDYTAITNAKKKIDSLIIKNKSDISLIPDEPLPPDGTLGFRIQKYDMKKWGDFFLPRQALLLSTLLEKHKLCYQEIKKHLNNEQALILSTILAVIVDRIVAYSANTCVWVSKGEFVGQVFSQGNALPMKWDFAEINILAQGSGNWDGAVDWVLRVINHIQSSTITTCATINKGTATTVPLPDDSITLAFSDPPYYDAFAYSDLSDFFYVWLKRSIGKIHPSLFDSILTNKKDEIVVNPVDSRRFGKSKDEKYFESEMTVALKEFNRILKEDYGLGVIVFAHKGTASWEALLTAFINAGLVIKSSWPIDTERTARLRATNSAALASSIHLVCRSRPQNAGIGDWRQVLSELQPRIHEWIPRLSKEGVVGADAIFSCLGPALEIFSRYERVETASGKKVELKEYLEHVWAAVAREALNMIFPACAADVAAGRAGADASGFEEDSRLTALWLWTLHSSLPVRERTQTGVNNISAKVNNKNLTDLPAEAPACAVGTADRSAQAGEDIDEEEVSKKTLKGFFLEYDAARKIAQGLGAHLEVLGGPGGIVEIKGDKARLVSVGERWKALFGKDLPASRGQAGKEMRPRRKKKSKQATLFDMPEEVKEEEVLPSTGKTVLDRLHQAMLLFADGRGGALRRFIVDEGVGNDDRFWRLAQSLSALYPPHTDEKRWVDGVLARKKSFGF
jgi:hypothetical protein